jgi:hypothetical protein
MVSLAALTRERTTYDRAIGCRAPGRLYATCDSQLASMRLLLLNLFVPPR